MQSLTYRCAECGALMVREEPLSEQGVPCPNCGRYISASAVVSPDDNREPMHAEPTCAIPEQEAKNSELLPAAMQVPSEAGREDPGADAELGLSSPQQHLVPEDAVNTPSAEIDSLERITADAQHAPLASTWLAKRGMRSNLFIALVLIPLISYAVLATIAIIILYSRSQTNDLFERLPDLEGDYPGAKHEKQGAIFYERLTPDLPLPESLQVALGKTIQVGDLAITPERVELRRINIRRFRSGMTAGIDESLVLHLLLQNTSADLVFYPMDPYFERRWKDPSHGSKPYDLLEIDGKRLFGGPLTWKRGRAPNARDKIEGQAYQALHPGETISTFVCTDPEDHVAKLLHEHPAHLLWRVQVRRGLVVTGKGERSATAVVGVRFAEGNIQMSEG